MWMARCLPLSAFTFTASTPFATAVSPAIDAGQGFDKWWHGCHHLGQRFRRWRFSDGCRNSCRPCFGREHQYHTGELPGGCRRLRDRGGHKSQWHGGTLPGGYTYAPGLGINFVQVNSAQPASPATTATVTYPLRANCGKPERGYHRLGTTRLRRFSRLWIAPGNTYALAFPANVGTGLSQAIYYAKNIVAAASNTVTVTFAVAAVTPDVRVLEYSGLDTTAPLDAAAGDSGISVVLDSGPITTTTAGDLVIGGSTVSGTVEASDLIFTTVANTSDGLSVEHLVGPAAGIFDVTATQNMNTNWVIQAVAFKQPGAIADFAMSVVPPTTASVIAGASATYTVAVSALNGFNNQVTLTCSGGLPLGSSCSFAPPSVIPAVTPVNSTSRSPRLRPRRSAFPT